MAPHNFNPSILPARFALGRGTTRFVALPPTRPSTFSLAASLGAALLGGGAQSQGGVCRGVKHGVLREVACFRFPVPNFQTEPALANPHRTTITCPTTVFRLSEHVRTCSHAEVPTNIVVWQSLQ